MSVSNGIFSLHFPTALSSINDEQWHDYPDVFSYSFSQEDYQAYWSKLSRASGYLMTKGTLVIRVNWFQMNWENLKGWFGYTNHCEENKVQMALRKTLYFGYLHGLNASIDVSDELNIPNDYIATCRQSKSDPNSRFLQQNLMQFFNEHFYSIPGFMGESYFFKDTSGQLMIVYSDAIKLFEIEPQAWGELNKPIVGCYFQFKNYKKIHQLLNSYDFNTEKEQFDEYNHYLLSEPSSAQFIYENPEVYNRWIQYLIDLLINNKMRDPSRVRTAITLIFQTGDAPNPLKKFIDIALRYSCYDIAINWIEVLAQTDSEAALNYVARHVNLPDLISPDSELGILYAKKILPSPPSMFSSFCEYVCETSPNENEKLYQLANKLDTGLRFTSEPAAQAYVSQLIKDRSWNEALDFYDLLKKAHSTIRLCPSDLETLARHLEKCGLDMQKQANVLMQRNIEEALEARKLYARSIQVFIDEKALHDTESCRVNLNNSCYAIIDILLAQQPPNARNYDEASEYMNLIDDNVVTTKSPQYEPAVIQLRRYAETLAGAPSSLNQQAEHPFFTGNTTAHRLTATPQSPYSPYCSLR